MVKKEDEDADSLSEENARGGNIQHRMIYVLATGLAVIILALSVVAVYSWLVR